MKTSRHREISGAILIDNFGRILLQRRDNVPGILSPGKVALFGGHRERDESFLECAVREIHEETSCYVPPERFEFLASIDGVDVDVEGGTIRGEFFVIRDVVADRLVITEGSLLIVPANQVTAIESELAPTAHYALRIYIEKGTAASGPVC